MPRSNRGNKFILVVVDVATRMVFLRGLKDKSMYSIAQKLLRLFCDVGFPRILGSDNGTEFNNQLLDAVKKISKIDSRFIAPYHHRSNGIVERTIRTVADAIYKQLEGLISLHAVITILSEHARSRTAWVVPILLIIRAATK